MSLYAVFEWVVVTVVVAVAAWRAWKTLAPKARSKDEPGCDAGCPSCNHCVTDPNVKPPTDITPREAPIHFLPRRR